MKPHLPVNLLRAVMVLMTMAPSVLYAKYTAPTEITVPDSYTNSETISGSADITEETESTVYRLTDDVTMSPSGSSYTGVSYLYTSDSADNLASVSFTKPSGSTKLAFSVSGTQVIFDSLNEVSFNSFSSSSNLGGAVNVISSSGNLIFSNNVKVEYNNNKVIPSGNSATGGGLNVAGMANFQNNKEVVFSGNQARSQGGAIGVNKRAVSSEHHLVINENDTVTFSNNSTNKQLAGLGGAIYSMMDSIQLDHNGSMTFSGNTAQATINAQGGAIYANNNGNSDWISVGLSHNNSLKFENNLVKSEGNSSEYAVGGAIMVAGTALELNNNENLSFVGNKAYATNASAVVEGGAIRAGYGSSLAIQNNQSVTFQDNKIQAGDTVRYNSIYADDSETKALNVDISARKGGTVEFRDCIYVDVSNNENSWFNLNSKYIDETGKEIAQTGDIVFTGAYMDSGDKTSEFKGTATLQDGNLVIKEGVVLQGENLAVEQSVSGESAPTVTVDNATLKTKTLSIAKGAALVNNNGTITSSEGITVKGGVVKGSGTFSSLNMDGGNLVVGATPGLQRYEGNVELRDVDVTFSLRDFTATAAADVQGWEVSAYSVIDMNGHDLTLGDNVNFIFELGGKALEQLLEPGAIDTLSLELVLIKNVNSLLVANMTLEDIIQNSRFVITTDEEGLLDGRYAAWAGKDITDHVTTSGYEQEGNVVLQIAAKSIPEPATATLSLLALIGGAARRRRKK